MVKRACLLSDLIAGNSRERQRRIDWAKTDPRTLCLPCLVRWQNCGCGSGQRRERSCGAQRAPRSCSYPKGWPNCVSAHIASRYTLISA
jgi:hypothetical protein